MTTAALGDRAVTVDIDRLDAPDALALAAHGDLVEWARLVTLETLERPNGPEAAILAVRVALVAASLALAATRTARPARLTLRQRRDVRRALRDLRRKDRARV